jgi:hypothetical protein
MSYVSARDLGMANNPRAAANIIDGLFDEGDSDQYKRELVVNAIQAGATTINVTAFRLSEYGKHGGIKAAFVDNGKGMSGTKIVDYMGELFNGESDVGPGGNFQMGGRVATLPFNSEGVLIASWVEGDESGSMVQIQRDPETGVYQLVAFGEPDDQDWVTYPDEEMKHPIIKRAGHGTVVILLGSQPKDHTVGEIGRVPYDGFSFPTVRLPENDWHYYNAKFWTLPEGVTLRMMWAQGNLKEWMNRMPPGTWYGQIEKREGEHFGHRTYDGIRGRIEKFAVPTPGANPKHQGAHGSQIVVSPSGHRATVHWALFPEAKHTRGDTGEQKGTGGASDQRDYGIPLGLFGELFQDEVYNLAWSKSEFDNRRQRGYLRTQMEYYGIDRKEIRDRMVLMVEPELGSSAALETRPGPARNRLVPALPHREWGDAFVAEMPEAIKQRLRELNTQTGDDAEDKKRLMDRLSKYFSRRQKAKEEVETRHVEPDPEQKDGVGGRETDTDALEDPTSEKESEIEDRADLPEDLPGTDGIGCGPRARKPKIRLGGGVKNVLTDGARERKPLGQDIEVEWNENGDQFHDDELAGLLVHWIGGAKRKLFINGAHPHLRKIIEEEVAQRSATKAEEIRQLAKHAIKMHMVAQVVCIEMMRLSSEVTDVIRSSAFRDRALSDEALSAVLMNEPSTRTVVTNMFRGRTGFGQRVDWDRAS